jgi:hypothetical protein
MNHYSVVEPQPSAADALREIRSLLREVSSASSPPRLSAVRYTVCRAALLDSALRHSLPGFLIQCVSIYKFHDFITLYDPRPEARLAFLDTAFGVSKSMLEAKRVYDVFGDGDL